MRQWSTLLRGYDPSRLFVLAEGPTPVKAVASAAVRGARLSSFRHAQFLHACAAQIIGLVRHAGFPVMWLTSFESARSRRAI